MLLALVGALLGWKGVAASLFGGSMIGSVIGVVVLALARRRGVAPEPTPSGDEGAGEGGGEGEGKGEGEGEGEGPSLMRTELPFGPFLAMAAVGYLLAEPWIQLYFRFPGG
jgi:prepilin signal peptidase PulO-like enzyme (type II secretory pathway)